MMETKSSITEEIIFEEHLVAMKKAAMYIQAQKPYTRQLDSWELINACYEMMTRYSSLQSTPKRYLTRKCMQIMAQYLRNKYHLSVKKVNLSLVFPTNSIDALGVKEKTLKDFLRASDKSIEEFDAKEFWGYITSTGILSEADIDILTLKYVDELPGREVAEIIGVESRQVVRNRLDSILKKIRIHLAVTGNYTR